MRCVLCLDSGFVDRTSPEGTAGPDIEASRGRAETRSQEPMGVRI